jgi:putative ABC transport system ATP-binding protein
MSGAPAAEIIRVENLTRVYQLGDVQVRALRGVTLTVRSGEFVAVRGPSGSGKSTFMNLLGCLDRPTNGRYLLAGEEVSQAGADRRAGIRNRFVGFVFQGFHLLPRTTALENVEVPLFYNGRTPPREREAKAHAALVEVGLANRERHYPSQLSGGQQQRVAIARALVNEPSLLLADEPTGNLDSRTSIEILALLQRLNRERGLTVLIVTHEADLAQFAGRNIVFRDGRVVDDSPIPAPRDAVRELASMPAEAEEEKWTS